MKILQVNKLYYPWIGGVETVVRQIAEGLKGKAQMEVLACQPKGKGRVEEINGVKIYKAASFGIMMGMPISLGFFCLFKKLAEENDLIFLHHPHPIGFLAYYLFGRSKKMVVWYHSDIVKQKFFGFLFSPILKAVLKKSR
ncbi:MAG: glycosyltransferase, partial [bacterium]|nr:glycosyltransferase [bacterium]